MLEEMHVFATIVEQSSLNRASALLNVTQPALSRKISKLEEELGVELFKRVGKRLELTRIGRITYEFAIELRTMQLRYLQSVNEFKSAGRTLLTIGASLTTLQTTLPDLIQVMSKAAPDLEIKAVTGKTHEIVSLVREQKIDLGIVASDIHEASLHCIPLFDDHLLVVVPKNQFVIDKGAIDISILNGLPMILFSKGTWYRTLTDELFQTHHLSPDVRMEIDSFEAILRLLHTCRSATLLPKSYVREQMLRDNDLSILPVQGLEHTRRTTSLIYNRSAELPGALPLWIDEIKGHFQMD
ncbi:LysR family transcriptional regulator [Paenibacillus pinihumi]|uniref:LysR family transcriptional regulator n=1 Tax=Paenibacillus pinihumi TaxID=669462 RepID=UPI0003FCB222|nr:LysR family transcriptional regulator [Paenibacillus pinihumi]